MDGDFELNKLGWYTPKIVTENDFLNAKLENDKYGIWYSVQFEGDAETHLWMAKSAPVAGERVYGHIEKTASGKSTKFKRAAKDQIPYQAANAGSATQTGSAPRSAYPKDDHTQESIARSVALKAAVDSFDKTDGVKVEDLEFYSQRVILVANEFLAWLQNNGSQGEDQVAHQPVLHSVTNEASSPKPAVASGYDKARAVADRLRSQAEEADAEALSLYQQGEQLPPDEDPGNWND